MSSRYHEEQNEELRIIGKVVLGVVAVLVALVLLSGFNRVEAGHVAAITRNGKLQGCEGPGLQWRAPIITKFTQFNVRKQTYELVDGEPKDSGSKAEYVDYNIDTNTKEGISFSAKLTVQYHIDPAKVCDIFNANMRTEERVQENVVKFHVRSITPQILNTYAADELYFGQLAPISAQIADQIRPRFAENGVVLDYFELKRGTFDTAYTDAIQGKAREAENRKFIEAQQLTQKAQNEKDRLAAEGAEQVQLIDARRESEKAKIAAQGAADSNVIAAKGAADAKKLQAEADAAYIAAQVEAYGGSEAYIQVQNAQAVANARAIYLPSSTIPLLNLTPAPEVTP